MSWFREQASEAIRNAGGRITAQRQLLIALLENSAGEFDVETLFHIARARDSNVSIATVYRTLNILEAARLVQHHYRSRDHERSYYELVSKEPAYHFTCRACHKIIPFHSPLVQELERQLAADLGLVVFGACICLDGLCADCQDKIKNDQMVLPSPSSTSVIEEK